MNSPVTGHALFIIKRHEQEIDEVLTFLKATGYDTAIDHDLGSAINRAQINKYDVIVLDADIESVPIERTIQILREIDPRAKIIVKTNSNSKELEAKVRMEKIFYYHLDSFGIDDLKLAVEGAIKQIRNDNIFLPRNKRNGKQQRLILMIDENDDFIEIHKLNLENHNFKVDICYDPDIAYQKLNEDQPDLLMVDMDIPVGSDGLHFMEKFLANRDYFQYPVLLFTSKVKLKNYNKLMVRVKSTLPNWTYLEKPVKIEDMIPKVEMLLSGVS